MKSDDTVHMIADYENIQPFVNCNTCEVCAKTFSNLKTHKLVNTGEKPHQCTSCQKTFSEASTLRKHHLTHTGEKPYNCTMCTSLCVFK